MSYELALQRLTFLLYPPTSILSTQSYFFRAPNAESLSLISYALC
jgi:hypothetical protein